MLKPIEYYSSHTISFKEDRKGYMNESMQHRKEFEDDLLDEYGVTNHPKARRAFELAWSYGHADGYQAVVDYFDEIVDLLEN